MSLIPFRPTSIVPISSSDVYGTRHPTGAYPIALIENSISSATIMRYSRWSQWYKWDFTQDHRPWLPVGFVGPLLVLGHHDVQVPPPLPYGAFQAVQLSVDDYDRHIRLCAPLIRNAGRIEWNLNDCDVVPPRSSAVPEQWIKPIALPAAIEWMLLYAPHSREDAVLLRQLAQRPSAEVSPEELPAGYWAASWKVQMKGQIVDLTTVKVTPELQARVPRELHGVITPVATMGTNLFVASVKTALGSARDILLNHLGDGWAVHCLLSSATKDIVRSNSGSAGDRPGGTTGGAVEKIVVETREVRPSGDRNKDEASWKIANSDVITITEGEATQLMNYEVKRPDRDPEKVFRRLIVQSLQQNASDLHIEPCVDKCYVRARVDGVLEEWMELPPAFGTQLIGSASTASGIRKERHQPEDTKCKVKMGAIEVNVRVSALPVRAVDRKLVFRFLPRKGEAPALKSILPEREFNYMKRAISVPAGLILICGPTGSGKTTTIASAITDINDPERNITTMEDPVEYEISRVNQAEVDEAREVGWSELTRSILRQDPDAGLLGEIRDQASAEAAIRLALTGHLVFATLHTISCAETMERLLDMGVNSNMLSSALSLIVSQRLVRRLCTNPTCRKERRLTQGEEAVYRAHGLPVPDSVVSPSDTCGRNCSCRSGYKGRVAAVEMLPITDQVKDYIAERKRAKVFAAWMRSKGLYNVHESALLLASKGVTSFEEANEWQNVWEVFPELQEDESLNSNLLANEN